MKPFKVLKLAAPLALFAGLAFADDVRLPPSVGATPIEIPYIDPDAPLVIDQRGLGQTGQLGTQLQAPDIGAVMGLPIPLSRENIARLDPRALPGAFSALPVPLPNPVRVALEGPFTYAVLSDRTVYGDTNFGYARFPDMDTYRAFLRSH